MSLSRVTIYVTEEERNEIFGLLFEKFEVEEPARCQFEFVTEHEKACDVLVTLRYEFPQGYVSGWAEPVDYVSEI